eukprot:5248406-Amphidinium_carterae.1
MRFELQSFVPGFELQSFVPAASSTASSHEATTCLALNFIYLRQSLRKDKAAQLDLAAAEASEASSCS